MKVRADSDLDEELKRALASGVSDRIVSEVNALIEQAGKVKKMLRPEVTPHAAATETEIRE